MRAILAAAALAVLLFGGPLLVSQQSSTPQSPASPLSVADVEHGLKAGVSNTRMAALVKQYGVDFSLTDAVEEQLRTAGANDELLLKIARAKSSSVASSTSTDELVKQANRYRLGDGVTKDESKAAELYRRAAESGDPEAQTRFGEALFDGRGLARDRAAAQMWFEKAATQNYALAETDLGVMLEEGLGVSRNQEKALEWFSRGAKHGNGCAEERLGQDAQFGRGVEKSDSLAYGHYSKGAAEGSAWAALALGGMYAQGIAVEKDPKLAFTWLMKAGAMKDPEYTSRWTDLCAEGMAISFSYTGIQDAYSKGYGVTKDAREADLWGKRYATDITEAAKNGWPVAQYKLSLNSTYGIGVPKDYTVAMEWALKAAEQDYAWAELHVAEMYRNGWGVTQDYQQAMTWYRKAADQGNANAQTWIGFLYLNGLGVKADDQQAMTWYRKAADQGDSGAQFKVGVLYEHGVAGTGPAYEQAMIWFRKAADQGNPNAQEWLGHFYINGLGVKTDYQEAMTWFRKAADQGNAGAQDGIGYLYEKGLGVTQSTDTARTWYQKAADKGSESAKKHLAALASQTGGSVGGTPSTTGAFGSYQGSAGSNAPTPPAGSVGTPRPYQGSTGSASTSSNSAGSLDAHDCLQRTSEPTGGGEFRYYLAFRNTCAKPVHLYYCYTTAGRGCWGCIMHGQNIATKSNTDYSATIGAGCQTQSCSELEVVWNATYVQTEADSPPNEIYPKKPNVDDSCSTTAH